MVRKKHLEIMRFQVHVVYFQTGVQDQLITSLSSATATSDRTDSTLHVVLMALPKQQQLALVQLSVFPSGFDETAASAVLGIDNSRARVVIQVRCTKSVWLEDHSLFVDSISSSTWNLFVNQLRSSSGLFWLLSVAPFTLESSLLKAMDCRMPEAVLLESRFGGRGNADREFYVMHQSSVCEAC